MESIPDTIIRIGAIAGALGVTGATVGAFLKYSTRAFAAAIHDIVSDKLDAIKSDTQQLKPNGGSSVADQRSEERRSETARDCGGATSSTPGT